MRKLAISLSKGGTGKTSTAISLAHGLAMAGRKVLLVDADTQGMVAPFLCIKSAAGLAELVSGEASADEAVIQARERLWILAGGRGLAAVKRAITRQDIGGERVIQEALEPMARRYQYILMDTAPGWDALTVAALFACSEVLAPVSLEVASLLGLVEFAKSLEAIQKYHPLRLRYIVPTFLDGRVRKSQEILEQLQSFYPGQVCHPIRYSVRISEAPGFHKTIYEYAPDSPGALDYETLTRRIISDE